MTIVLYGHTDVQKPRVFILLGILLSKIRIGIQISRAIWKKIPFYVTYNNNKNVIQFLRLYLFRIEKLFKFCVHRYSELKRYPSFAFIVI